MKRLISGLLLTLWLAVGCFCAQAETLRFDAVISPNLPEMTLDVVKVGEETGFFDAWEPAGTYQVTVFEKGRPDTVIQQFTFPSYESLDRKYTFTLADLNFDGYMDLDILYYAAASNTDRLFYLWNVEKRQFEQLKLEELFLSNHYTLYPEYKALENYVHDSAMTGEWTLYQYRDGAYEKVARAVTSSHEYGERYGITAYSISPEGEMVIYEGRYSAEEYESLVFFAADLLWQGIDDRRAERAYNVIEQLAIPAFVRGEYLRLYAFISEFMPEMMFEFFLSGNENGEYTYQVEVRERENRARLVQRFQVRSNQKLHPANFVTLVDIDFDGYLDLEVAFARDSYEDPLRRAFYLWDPALQQYNELPDLASMVSGIYTLYPEKKMLRNDTYADETHTADIYLRADGAWTLIRRMTVMYGGDPVALTISDFPSGMETVRFALDISAEEYWDTYFDAEETRLLFGGL